MGSKIYFITINYYSAKLLRSLLHSIQQAADSSGDRAFEILIVNNSPDDSEVESLIHAPSISLISPKINLGFGGGCNVGIQAVYQRDPQAIVWLINPDALLTADAIAYVRQCLQQEPAIAILGTRIQDLEGRLWYSQGTFNRWTGSLKHRFDTVDCTPSPPATHPTRWVSGCSLILNLATFDQCPSFDTTYFLDYEDADLCERYAQQGYPVHVTQAVLVHHHVSAITQRNLTAKFQHAAFSKLYFLYRHATPLALWANMVYIMGKVLWHLPRRPDIAHGRLRGLFDFWQWRYHSAQPNTPFRPRSSFTRAPATTTDGPKL
ncbi:glycosyltransferase [Leptolyngbya sp. AN02str]|uniref:glycosyltransferase n=1 Tax=Leptolyngbya sp. AN02str TaxID=3423363 RepID=UPI003D31D8AD